jgi:uncharacterized protein
MSGAGHWQPGVTVVLQELWQGRLLMLDVIVEPDRSWRWKDEDEFAALVAAGLIGAAEAARVRDEALRVTRGVEANAPPFNERWHDWRPDPTWPSPALPAGWDRL